ncbi:hypothetical protein OS493_001084 [Desmophyllum pertusum]|uniref:Uncharacterized protein n=1 Tax=Desmophyllum pertusum TaxID=174260 RepID=A0A9W9ZTV5_9CNID|nr:hypothetical protein OS493_001084 [Desmophyllum pertusum]
MSSSLTNSCSADKYLIEGEEQDVRKRFDNLSCDVPNLEDNLTTLKEALEQYNKALAPVEELLERTEKSLASREPTGINVRQRAREPDVNDLMEAGDKLTSAMDPKSAEAPRVKQEVEAVYKRYNDLLESLDNEKDQLEKETEKALKFQDALRNLEEWLPRVEDAVAAQEPISSDPEVVKQQLQQAEALRDELARNKALLDTLEDTGREIIADSSEDPQVVRDVRGELNKIISPVDVILRKLAERQVRLQNALLRSQEFQVSFDEFMAKLDTFEEQLASQEPISAVHETVQVQRQENETLQKDLALQDPVFEKLVQNGQGVVDALDDAPERDAMEQKIAELKTRWQDAKGKVDDRQDQLIKVETEAQKFRQEADSLSLLLADAEQQVEAFEPLTVDIDSIAKQKELVQQIQGMVNKLKSDVREVGGSAEELKEQAERDVPVVKAEADDFVARIEKLSASLDERGDQLSAIEAASHDYHVTVQKVEDVFSEAYDVVDAPVVCGTDTESATQQLAKIKELSAILDGHAPEVQNISHKGDSLLQQVHDSSPDHALVSGKVAHVSQKFEELQQKAQISGGSSRHKIKDTDDFNAKDLKAQLEEKKPTLEDAQGLCGKLTDQNKDEPLMRGCHQRQT